MSRHRGIGVGLRPRDRRAINLGLLVIVPALVLGAGAPPYLASLEEAQDRLSVERSLLSRELALVADSALALQRETAAAGALAAREPRLFSGEPAIAAGGLVRYVARAAELSGVRLESTETAGTDAAGPTLVEERIARDAVAAGSSSLTAVRVQLRATGDLMGVLELMRRLEDGPRLIRIEDLSLERIEGYTGVNDGVESVQVVVLSATLAGYTLAVEESTE